MNSTMFRLAVTLGLITAIGPFAVDMYLPALPTIGQSLQASPAAIQMSLTAYFITMGVCQLFWGPLADMIGRKPPIYVGLSIFIVGSVGCALAPDIETLIAFRVMQAFGACAGMVVPRALVRDLYTGAESARLGSMLMLVLSISPILAPLSGSAVIAAIGWRAVFWSVAAAAVLGLVLAAALLKETRPREARAGATWGAAFAGYRTLMTDRGFLGLVFIGAFGISAFFVYLANSSFVLIEHYGVSSTAYSVYFALNAVSFFGVAQAAGPLIERFGLTAVVRAAVTGLAAVLLALFALFAAGFQSLWLMAAGLFLAYGFLGLVVPATGVMAMDANGDLAGAASALMGALQMVTGAAVMALAGLFANGSPLPMVGGIAACGAAAFVTAMATLPKAPQQVQAAAE
jgi:MFS transporter, DHA1 family, multidrug resistance protein